MINRLFDEINIEDKASFVNAELAKVKLIKEKNVSLFFIDVDHVIPPTSYIEIYNKLKASHYNGIPMINVRNHILTIDYIYAFIETLKNNGMLKNASTFNDIPKDRFHLNNNALSITALNDIDKKYIDTFFVDTKKILLSAGIRVDINVTAKHVELEKLVEEDKKKIAQAAASIPTSNTYEPKEDKTSKFKKRFKKTYRELQICELSEPENQITFVGTVFNKEARATKSKSVLFSLDVSDGSDSISIKKMKSPHFNEEIFESIKKGSVIRVSGSASINTYANNEIMVWADKIEDHGFGEERKDGHTPARVELHAHTKSSAMDGVCDVKKLIQTAHKWGHKAIAITDHNVVHAFPDAQSAAAKIGDDEFKVLYGCEFDVIDSKLGIAKGRNTRLDAGTVYTVFDLETTGLNANYDEIIEFGAIKVSNGVVLDRKQIFVKPNRPIPAFISELTGISDNDVADARSIEEVMPEIIEFMGDSVLVAHNAEFDMGFMQRYLEKLDLPLLENTVIDTLKFGQAMLKMKNYRLGTLAKKLFVSYDSTIAHRADYDANVLADVFAALMKMLPQKDVPWFSEELEELEGQRVRERSFARHLTIIAKNQAGLKRLFELVSIAHTRNFARGPKLFWSDIEENRTNLLIGSSCVKGEIFVSAMNDSDKILRERISKFDYIEVQPPSVYTQLVERQFVDSEKTLEEIIERIVDAGIAEEKIVVATGDVHYIDPEDKTFREILIRSKGVGGSIHPLFDFKGRMNNLPEQHLRTTQEMMNEFNFMDQSKAFDIVVTNTNKVASLCSEVKPIKSELYTPKIENADQKLEDMVWKSARDLFGQQLPEIVEKRIKHELKPIIGYGFGVIYYISHLLVKKSLDDGYIVGSRGSVGSSLVATFAGITDVNPLPPFYACPKCKRSEFITDGSTASGFDLPKKACECGHPDMIRNGQDIPFETFLGFKGDKVPDIDLNFSGEYQPVAHNYTKELFGAKNVLRAGTISTVATKTAFGYTLNYAEQKDLTLRRAEIERLAFGCEGVKRTTGQHPGGIIIIPDEYDICDFTPFNFPADDTESPWLTTHFDFHSIHDNLLKLDILGHLDPTAIKMLENLTGIKPNDVPMNDEQVISLFSSCEVLGIEPDTIMGETTGAIGIPEFGTQFVRKMLSETKPQSFSDLIQISGLSHGTDVWIGNARDLIVKSGKKLSETIGCRDDIMVYLIHKGLPEDIAFKIMEDVRKGRQVKPDYAKQMLEVGVDQWYIDSCNKIKYMFPKAHAVAYVSIAWKIAWFKVYYPLEFYATYLSTRCSVFDIAMMTKSATEIKDEIKRVRTTYSKNKKDVSNKELSLIPVYEIILELIARGMKLSKIDLEKSLPTKWVIDRENNALIPPFITVDGLGESVAYKIEEARNESEFKSIQDFTKRGGVNKTTVASLKEMGVLDGMDETQQLSLF